MVRWIWLVVGFCFADLEDLEPLEALGADGECEALAEPAEPAGPAELGPGGAHKGSCAFRALQRRAARASRDKDPDHSLLCSKADGVCSLLSGDGRSSLALSDLRMLLAVAPSTFQAYADAVQLEKTAVQGGHVHCAELCRLSVQFLASQNVVMPPGPDIGCYQDAQGHDICSEDLSPQTLATRFANSEDLQSAPSLRKMRPDQADQAEPFAKRKAVGKHRRQRGSVRVEDPYQHTFEVLVKSYSSELALRILYMFRVYPRAFNSYLAGSDAQPKDWQNKLAKFNLVARVFIMNAIRNLRLHRTVLHLQKWFGDDAVTGPSLNETRVEVLRLLNSAVHVMNTAEFLYNASDCDDSTFAFVYPSTFDGVPDLQGAFRRNQKGQPVVYVCILTVVAERLGLLADAIQTFIHESSHHAVAYTDDVAICPQYQYTWLETSGLPHLNGSECPDNVENQPRFSIFGLSCDVPGAEILKLANITRPPYARGSEDSTRCPVNLGDLKTASACKRAAEYLGQTYIEEEEDADWPHGCYEIAAGRYQGVYFNKSPTGSAVRGTFPLCKTVPLHAPATADGSCPATHVKSKTGACELALPFFAAEKGSNECPSPTESVDQLKTCRDAANLLGLTWGDSIATEDYPGGCFAEHGQVSFNKDVGTWNDGAAPICKQAFSYSIFDPRVTYYLQLQRFSQSGDAALFKYVPTDSSDSDCDIAYGRARCQALAQDDPGKALMNADSFGYYVLDAGNPEAFGDSSA